MPLTLISMLWHSTNHYHLLMCTLLLLSPYKAFLSFLSLQMPVDIANLRLQAHVEDLLQRARKTKWGIVLIELTDQFDTSLMSKALAFQHRGNVLVGESRGSNAKLAKEFGLGSLPPYPQYIAICASNDDKLANLVYNGKRTKKQLDEWLNKNFQSKAARMRVCDKLRKSGEASRAKAKDNLSKVLRLSKAELEKKRVKELRELCEDLGGINVALLKEKGDFVEAILSIGKQQRVDL
jgi:hypothetical protein